MLNVKKRNGDLVSFDIKKIEVVIQKAFEATEKIYSDDIIALLALRVSSNFQNKIRDEVINVEDIQDAVEVVLIQAGYADVAKAFILYREQHKKIREAKKTLINYADLVDNYLNVKDWRVKENSTVTYSVG